MNQLREPEFVNCLEQDHQEVFGKAIEKHESKYL
jgi:hypothetical protein